MPAARSLMPLDAGMFTEASMLARVIAPLPVNIALVQPIATLNTMPMTTTTAV